MVNKKEIENILIDINKIIDKANLGKRKVEGFRQVITPLYKDSATFTKETEAFLISSYDDIRSLSKDICNDVQSFNISSLADLIKNPNKIDSYLHKKDYILARCDYIVKDDDWKEFTTYLTELAQVFDKKEERVKIIDKISDLVDIHYDIYDKTSSLFSDIKTDIEKALKKEEEYK